MTNLDRSEINRALAKAIAYKQCGKDLEARKWAAALVGLLECASILTPAATKDARDMVFHNNPSQRPAPKGWDVAQTSVED